MPSLSRIAGRARTAPAAAVAPVAMPTQIHDAVLQTMNQTIGYLAANMGTANVMVRTMFGLIQNSQGMMRDALSRMPEETLRGHLLDARARIDAALADG